MSRDEASTVAPESANKVFYLSCLGNSQARAELPYLLRHLTPNKTHSVFSSLLSRFSHGNVVTYAIASKL